MGKQLDLVSRVCLRGKPVPGALAKLWAAAEADDEYLMDTFEIELLTSLDTLENGYGDKIAKESEDIAANVRAHKSVFERLGFFADAADGDLLAFDLELGPADNPPVLKLDSEGQYDWAGIDLAEALLRIADDRDELESMQEWLAEREIPHGELSVVGASTQFLPSIADLHVRRYYANLGEPRREFPSSTTAATAADPATWLLRPGPEVRAVLVQRLGLAADASFDNQWVACDGQGRVCSIWLHKIPATADIRLYGVGFGDARASAIEALGKPASEGDNDWAAWKRGPAHFHLTFKKDHVSEIGLFLPDADDDD